MLRRKFRLSFKNHPTRSSPSYRSPLFTLCHSPNNYSYNRFAVIVTKNAVKKAVERNILKRFLTHELKKLPNTGWDLLLILHKAGSKIPKKELKKELERALL